MAYKAFINGVGLPASDLNTYLMKQSVMVFASAAARDAALTAAEGMVVYLEDTNAVMVYDGVAWSNISSASAWTTYTPTTTNITVGNGTWSSSYIQLGKTVHIRVRFTLGSTSAITGAATFSLPITAAGFAYGTANLNAGSNYQGVAAISGTTNVVANAVNAAGTYAVQSSTNATVPATWATGHTISISLTYEAA
jgi:hypothetical protein